MNKIKIGIITLFPKIFENFINYGLLKKAIKNNIIDIKIINLRNYSFNNKIDDYTYGGGNGMVIMCEPIYKSILKLKNEIGINSKVIYLSPQGKIMNQNYINKLSKNKSIILLCGRYEGIDERIINSYIDEEISIGDYILSGGEIPAMVLIETLYRLIPGVINKNSIENESFSNGLLDYSHYTRPKNFMNYKVPSILLSGNHNKINEWRFKKSLENTWIKRPDLIKKKILNNKEKKILKKIKIKFKYKNKNV